MLMVGVDACVQVVNDDARAQGVPSKESMGPKCVEGREGQREREQGGPTSEASSGVALTTQSGKKTAVVCDQPPGLDELAGHIEAPHMGAGSSHPPGHNDVQPMGHSRTSLCK